MPQFETERPGEPALVVRALDATDAVRRAFSLPPEASVSVGPPAGPAAWSDVTVGGEAAGRVRAHARMRFRRD
ncbi:MAG TPA: hypothetical protein VF576_07725 [Rubricoccaceae bacterium]